MTISQEEFIELIKAGRKDPVLFAEKILGLSLHDKQKIWMWTTTKTQLAWASEIAKAIGYEGLPDLEILEKFANKKIFHLLLKDLNLAQYQPNIYLDQDITQFPIVLKRTNLNACQGIRIIFTRQELTDSLSQDMWRRKEIIIQEFIENTNEFVWHAVYKDGVRLWEATIKYVKSNSLILRGPNSQIDSMIIESNPDATKVFDQIMSKTNYSGPCNIDFSYESSNLKIFEINPRIGGSLMNPENKELLAQALNAIIKAT